VNEHEKQSVVEQSAVSRAIWPWPQGAAAGRDERAVMKRKALTQAAVLLVIALLLYFLAHHRVMAGIVVGLACVVVLGGLFVPPVFRAIDRFGRWLGHVVGAALTWILLVPFFYLCFVPGRFLLLVLRKDPMKRELAKDVPSYWIPYATHEARDYYRKQF
jgi:hypothetical protein